MAERYPFRIVLERRPTGLPDLGLQYADRRARDAMVTYLRRTHGDCPVTHDRDLSGNRIARVHASDWYRRQS